MYLLNIFSRNAFDGSDKYVATIIDARLIGSEPIKEDITICARALQWMY
jgi:hypothetical protein